MVIIPSSPFQAVLIGGIREGVEGVEGVEKNLFIYTHHN